MRKSTIFIGAGLLFITLFALVVIDAAVKSTTTDRTLAQARTLVRELGLTDLALFSEANYTRHPSLTDFSTPLQDSPMSFEHFQSGALLSPPAQIEGGHVKKL